MGLSDCLYIQQKGQSCYLSQLLFLGLLKYDLYGFPNTTTDLTSYSFFDFWCSSDFLFHLILHLIFYILTHLEKRYIFTFINLFLM